LLTCREFLAELTDFLDERTQAELRARLEAHLALCPNCWVVCDTTRKTIQVYKGMETCTIPDDVHERLMAAVERRLAARDTSD
jgi:anti-sigma factor RsiW